MKFLCMFMMLLSTSVQIVKCQYGDFKPEEAQFSYNPGNTQVTFYNYATLKITAEQNTNDNQLLVIAFPQKEGVSFTITGVTVTTQPSQANVQGPVANVSGTMLINTNQATPLSVPLTVPIEISQTSQYTIPPQEALMQGYQFYQMAYPAS